MRYPTIALRHVAEIPVTTGLGEAADSSNAEEWPRYIRTTDIASLFSLHEDRRVTLPPEKASLASVARDDILMTAAGSIGKSYQHLSDDAACYAGYVARWRPRTDRIVPRFAAYWTASQHFADQIAVGAVKSTIENFSASKYRAMRVPVPELAGQRAIADFLDRETAQIDTLIAKQQRLIATLRERRRAVIAEASVRGVRPGADLVDPRISWVGLVPAHWTRTRHSAVLRESKRPVGAESESAVLLSLTKQGVIARDVTDGKGKYPASFDTYQWVDDGQLVFCLFDVDETPRTVGLARQRGMVTGAYDVFDVDMSVADPAFLEYYFIAIDDEKRFRPLYTGLRKVIQKPRFKAAPMVLPPLTEQKEIAAHLDQQTAAIDALIQKSERLIELSQERRAALITAAVTGQIDVRKAA